MVKIILSLKSVVILTVLFVTLAQAQTSKNFACLQLNRDTDFSPYWTSDTIFSGTAKNVAVEGDKVVAEFTVEQTFRGTAANTNLVFTPNSDYGYHFIQGERYFVYASHGKNGLLYTNGCGGPTVLLKDAAEDLEYAREIAAGQSGTRIYGSIYQDNLNKFSNPVPLSGIEVTIQNKSQKFNTKTDEKGGYVFKDIPAGLYNVRTEKPANTHEKILSRIVEERGFYRNLGQYQAYIGQDFTSRLNPSERKSFYRHWDRLNFYFSSLSSIKGRVVINNGGVPPQTYIWLLPIDKNGKAMLDSLIAYSWIRKDTGDFTLEDIPKGDYLLAINPLNCHNRESPEYARSFFPGTIEENQAQKIVVGENQQIKLQKFILPLPLAIRRITGVVLATDGKPIPGATVYMLNKAPRFVTSSCFDFSDETTTDELGRFYLKGYETYEYEIRAVIKPQQQTQWLSSPFLQITLKENAENLKLTIDSKLQ